MFGFNNRLRGKILLGGKFNSLPSFVRRMDFLLLLSFWTYPSLISTFSIHLAIVFKIRSEVFILIIWYLLLKILATSWLTFSAASSPFKTSLKLFLLMLLSCTISLKLSPLIKNDYEVRFKASDWSSIQGKKWDRE